MTFHDIKELKKEEDEQYLWLIIELINDSNNFIELMYAL